MRKKVSKHVREKVKKSYGAIAAEFSASRKVPWKEFDHFLAYVRKGSKVLDLGCGNGRLYEFLKKKDVKYFGADNNSHLLDEAKKNYPKAKFELADMVDLRLPKGAFDTLFCIAAFHHVPGKKSRKKAVANMQHVLKEDGVLILTVWNLFQRKYFLPLLKAIFSSILHLGFKYSWNDLWIKWGHAPIPRYYHAFLPKELLRYFDDGWEIEEFYFTRKGNRVSFLRSFNLVLIARKK